MKGWLCAMAETWILYQTTNVCNGKIYVGVHKVQNTSKSKCYIGSGDALQLAVKKYGRKNFVRITLAKFSCSEDAYFAEAEMVTEEFVKRPDTYNMKNGGRGGIGVRGKKLSEKHREAFINSNRGRKFSDEHKKKLSEAKKGRKLSPEHIAKLGKLKSKETLEKISGKNNWRSMAVVINGNYYESGRLGAKVMNMCPCVLSNRVKSTQPKWSEWRYATPEEKLSHA
jgi:hypothetical protein